MNLQTYSELIPTSSTTSACYFFFSLLLSSSLYFFSHLLSPANFSFFWKKGEKLVTDLWICRVFESCITKKVLKTIE